MGMFGCRPTTEALRGRGTKGMARRKGIAMWFEGLWAEMGSREDWGLGWMTWRIEVWHRYRTFKVLSSGYRICTCVRRPNPDIRFISGIKR